MGTVSTQLGTLHLCWGFFLSLLKRSQRKRKAPIKTPLLCRYLLMSERGCLAGAGKLLLNSCVITRRGDEFAAKS